MKSCYACESCRPLYPVPNHHHHHHYYHHPMIRCPQHHHHHHLHTILCPLHHHHHHHRHTILCPVHQHHHRLITCHSHVSPALAPLHFQVNLNSGSTTVRNEARHSGTLVLQEQECEGLEEGEGEEEEEEEEEPVFVLTDEWREFFAKSEAKRKLEKQQSDKKKKY